MNASGVFVLLFAIVAAVLAFPAVDELKQDGLYIQVREEEEAKDVTFPDDALEEEDENGVRFRRATCDLLSISLPFGSLNHSACAAHCLAKRKGYRGGRCRDGVCHCRR